jgi:hypothetical protein
MRKIIECVPKPFLAGLLIASAVGAYGWVGESDYQEQIASAERYCEMSAKKLWPPRPELNCPAPDAEPGLHLANL